MPPGGHVEEGELPHTCALREALEETGLEVELIVEEEVWVEQRHAASVPRPYHCLVEEIPTRGDVAEHHHLDFIYVGHPKSGELCHCAAEATDIRWFERADLEALEAETIYPEVREIALRLLHHEAKAS